MTAQLADVFYRLALSSAAQHDLSRAVVLARCACGLDERHEKAVKLLELCLYELGSLKAGSGDGFEQIRAAAEHKKWREASRLAGAIEHRSVRVLNIQGCIFACAKRYKPAARAFSQALEKDRGNKAAAAFLAEAAGHQDNFWRLI